jgi:Ca2+/Na+ antiporter
MGIFTIKDMVKGFLATVRSWRVYKRQTGEWPFLSIALYLLDLVLLCAGMAFLIWFSVNHHWSKMRLALIALLLLFPFVLFWSWLEDRIRLTEIRRFRRRNRKNLLKSPSGKHSWQKD